MKKLDVSFIFFTRDACDSWCQLSHLSQKKLCRSWPPRNGLVWVQNAQYHCAFCTLKTKLQRRYQTKPSRRSFRCWLSKKGWRNPFVASQRSVSCSDTKTSVDSHCGAWRSTSRLMWKVQRRLSLMLRTRTSYAEQQQWWWEWWWSTGSRRTSSSNSGCHPESTLGCG